MNARTTLTKAALGVPERVGNEHGCLTKYSDLAELSFVVPPRSAKGNLDEEPGVVVAGGQLDSGPPVASGRSRRLPGC